MGKRNGASGGAARLIRGIYLHDLPRQYLRQHRDALPSSATNMKELKVKVLSVHHTQRVIGPPARSVQRE